MHTLELLRRLYKPPTRVDPFFGTIRYQRVGFWEAKMYFAPEEDTFEIAIDANAAGPTRSQKHFFQELERRYPALKQEIGGELLDQLRNWTEDADPEAVWQRFRLDSFGIPNLDAGNTEWELVYEHLEDGHYFCVIMQEWQIEGIRVDG
jgi:hypothetical protein